MERYQQLALQLRALVIFRQLLENEVVSSLLFLLEADPTNQAEAVTRYAEFAARLYEETHDWGEYLITAVLEDENRYMLRRAQEKPIAPVVEACLEAELAVLQEAASVKSNDIREAIGFSGFLPDWENTVPDFCTVYHQRIATVAAHGYGIYAKYHTFLLKEGTVTPVKHPDETMIAQLSGYEEERKQVLDNTSALLRGRPAANILLYGDAGTGKSSTVKAAANCFRDQGLRLIEVKKEQLHQIPELIDTLSKNPLKFILFIDDLSFTRDDDNFSALKAVLEGTVAAKTNNIVIYATSNRRHLVKESFSDRNGDDIHFNDTMQELTSLSDRFGLTITFMRPDIKQYLRIASALAMQYGIAMDEAVFASRADAYALRRSGYSPRVAKQFVESLKSED